MFREKLRLLRGDRKLSQKEISAALEISQQAYSNYESGNREPDIAMLITIADYFNVTLDYLLGRTNEKRPASAEAGAWVLTADEAALIADYRALNADGRTAVANTAHGFVLSGAYKKADPAGRIQIG